MRWCWAAALLLGCSFDDNGVAGLPQPGVDAGPRNDAQSAIDAAPTTPDGAVSDIPHVPPDHAGAGTADLTLTSATIDTSALTVTGAALPAGVTLDRSPQSCNPCPELAILHVHNLTIQAGNTVRVIGSRPLVIIAGGDVTIAGLLDASAHGAEPGAGGAAPGDGPGAGTTGVHREVYEDSGGGGAGAATMGAKGGDASGEATPAAGARPGAMYGEPMISFFTGGSGGGAG